MASLLTVTGGRIELELKRSYVIGRAPDCDLVVLDPMSSRRHARIHTADAWSVVTIEDLKSSNGTFVDDVRIKGSMALRNHTRIRIGATIYMFSLVAAGTRPEWAVELDGRVAHFLDMTVTLDESGDGRPAGSQTTTAGAITQLAGQLGDFSLLEIMRFMLRPELNGTLHVVMPSGIGEVEIRAGTVLHAVYRHAQGWEALVELAQKRTGLFWLIDGTDPCPDSIHTPTPQLVPKLMVALEQKGL